MELSVVIPTWRRPRELTRCLDALEAQTLPPTEVLVVIREEDAQSRGVLEERTDAALHVRPVTVEEPGLVAAMNAGLRAARGEAVAFTDDDAVPHPDWLARIEGHLDADPLAGGVGGRDWLTPWDAPPVDSGDVGRVRWYGRRTGYHHRGVGPPRSVEVLKGVNMAFRRDAIETFGFDERLRGTGAQHHSEVALCLAVKRAGWRLVYDPAVAVGHEPGTRFGDQRLLPDPEVLRSASFNETYAMLRWLPWWRKIMVFGYGVLVGTREAPGLITAMERVLRTRHFHLVLARLGAATRGRLDALGVYAGLLREGSESKDAV